MTTDEALTEAARAFLDALEPGQRAKAVLAVDDDTERRRWQYWPAPRKGFPLGAMSGPQQHLARRLLATALSAQAFVKATSIVSLEPILDEVEGGSGFRDPGLYFVTLFGEPSRDEPWSWRFEGHHVCVNQTVNADAVTSTPLFLGSNPATVWHDGRVVLRPLGEEEDVARELLASLDDGQRAAAIVDRQAPDDILTSNLPALDAIPDGGLPAGRMGAEQVVLLERLVDVYVSRLPSDLAARERDRVDLGHLAFAWAGSTQRGERHYYRVSGRTFLIEYDNTQNDANHVHAVWRDLERDFGTDLLREHVSRDH